MNAMIGIIGLGKRAGVNTTHNFFLRVVLNNKEHYYLAYSPEMDYYWVNSFKDAYWFSEKEELEQVLTLPIFNINECIDENGNLTPPKMFRRFLSYDKEATITISIMNISLLLVNQKEQVLKLISTKENE